MDFGAKPISICLVMLDNPGVLNTMFSLGKANNFSTKENRCEDCLMLVTKYSMYATWGACSRVLEYVHVSGWKRHLAHQRKHFQ